MYMGSSAACSGGEHFLPNAAILAATVNLGSHKFSFHSEKDGGREGRDACFKQREKKERKGKEAESDG